MGCGFSSDASTKKPSGDLSGVVPSHTKLPSGSSDGRRSDKDESGYGRTDTNLIEDEIAHNETAKEHMAEVLHISGDAKRTKTRTMTSLRRSLEPTADGVGSTEDQAGAAFQKRVQQWKDAFQKYAQRPAGDHVLEAGEVSMTFQDIYTMFFEEGLGSRVEALVWFNKADADRSQRVTWQEFNQAMTDTLHDKRNIMKAAAKCARRAVFLEEFSRYDEDGSGGVTLKEMKKIFRQEAKGGRAEALSIFVRLDKSGDGVVTFDEYVVGMEELLKEQEELENMTKQDSKLGYFYTLFKYFDTDHSGSITFREMRQSYQRTQTTGYEEAFSALEAESHHDLITASGFIKILQEANEEFVGQIAHVGRALARLEGAEIVDVLGIAKSPPSKAKYLVQGKGPPAAAAATVDTATDTTTTDTTTTTDPPPTSPEGPPSLPTPTPVAVAEGS